MTGTKLCESCRGRGTERTGPRFAGDDDELDVPFAAAAPTCEACDGRGRVGLDGTRLPPKDKPKP